MRNLHRYLLSLLGIACVVVSSNLPESSSTLNADEHKSFGQNEILMIEPSAMVSQGTVINKYGEEVFINDYYAPYYFRNLENRFGVNVKGTCTYVAIDMLLSYYDCFWNDAFMPG